MKLLLAAAAFAAALLCATAYAAPKFAIFQINGAGGSHPSSNDALPLGVP